MTLLSRTETGGSVIDDAAPVINDARRTRWRNAQALSRWRRKRGIHRRTVSLTEDQLDTLERRGYLDPDRRGDRNDECDAIEMFLTDSLLNG